MSHPKTLVRELGASERLMYHYSVDHPRHFCVVAEIEALKLRHDYEAACEALRRRHPLLNITLLSNDAGVPGFYASEAPIEPILRHASSKEPWTDFVANELISDFPVSSPLCRIAILCEEAAATIVLTMHHAVGDGLSGIALIEDFLTALSGLDIGELQVPLAIEDALRETDAELLTANKGTLALPSVEQLVGLAAQPLWRPFDGDQVVVKTETISPGYVHQLRGRAKANGTSFNSAICAAVAIVAARRERRENYNVLSPIDLRRKFGLDLRDCVLRATAGTVTLPTDQDIWSVARCHIEDMNRLRTTGAILQTGHMLERLITPSCDPRVASGVLGALNYDAVVSNLGVVEVPQQYGDIRLAALWGPAGQARLKRERFFGVTTFAGTLRLIEACPASQELICTDVIELLINACE
ncbi:hypothetical protein [Rhizobium sp. S163]|uniref:hypothetical protein n=1 Tax=Rhizobium sp. S163 TaxID=3055039 RepID=UPI0025A94BAB|nr:hypothetical protein [Rhizobium sp. S163]MDM9648347.1 hypothetical protein [Rhizobium sp. S163]